MLAGMKALTLSFAVVATLTSLPLVAQEDLGPEAAFKRGAELMEKGQFKEAVPYLKRAEKAFPTAPPILWNLGIASAELGNHAEALIYWQKYHKGEPDWRSIPKLIQSYQAMGDLKARDRELRALYDLRASGKDPKLAAADKFCREQFVAGGQKIFAYEIFEPRGERRMYYRFSIVGADGRETSFIWLGSDDTTTQIMRELGKLSKTQWAFHIDRQTGGLHQTYAHFNEKPPYEVVRKAVGEIVAGKVRPVSGSTSKP
jgi:tetratricopeptide (TPR) repeat protein